MRELFSRLDVDVLDRVLGAWAWTRTHMVEGRRIIAIDGKSERGAKDASGVMPHLVAALDHDTGAVLCLAEASRSAGGTIQ